MGCPSFWAVAGGGQHQPPLVRRETGQESPGGLDTIRVDVHHQGADLAAGSDADRHQERCE